MVKKKLAKKTVRKAPKPKKLGGKGRPKTPAERKKLGVALARVKGKTTGYDPTVYEPKGRTHSPNMNGAKDVVNGVDKYTGNKVILFSDRKNLPTTGKIDTSKPKRMKLPHNQVEGGGVQAADTYLNAEHIRKEPGWERTLDRFYKRYMGDRGHLEKLHRDIELLRTNALKDHGSATDNREAQRAFIAFRTAAIDLDVATEDDIPPLDIPTGKGKKINAKGEEHHRVDLPDVQDVDDVATTGNRAGKTETLTPGKPDTANRTRDLKADNRARRRAINARRKYRKLADEDNGKARDELAAIKDGDDEATTGKHLEAYREHRTNAEINSAIASEANTQAEYARLHLDRLEPEDVTPGATKEIKELTEEEKQKREEAKAKARVTREANKAAREAELEAQERQGTKYEFLKNEALDRANKAKARQAKHLELAEKYMERGETDKAQRSMLRYERAVRSEHRNRLKAVTFETEHEYEKRGISSPLMKRHSDKNTVDVDKDGKHLDTPNTPDGGVDRGEPDGENHDTTDTDSNTDTPDTGGAKKNTDGNNNATKDTANNDEPTTTPNKPTPPTNTDHSTADSATTRSTEKPTNNRSNNRTNIQGETNEPTGTSNNPKIATNPRNPTNAKPNEYYPAPLNPSELPDVIDHKPTKKYAKFDGDELPLTDENTREALQGVLTAVGKDDTLPMLKGVMFTPGGAGDHAEVAATDRFMLTTAKLDIDFKGVDKDRVLIDGKDLRNGLKSVGKNPGKLTIEKDGDTYLFSFTNGKQFTAKELNEEYPNYKALMGRHRKIATFNRAELADALKDAVSTGNKKNNLVVLETTKDGDKTRVRWLDALGVWHTKELNGATIHEKTGVQSLNDENRISDGWETVTGVFNAKYLKDLVSATRGDFIEIQGAKSSSPAARINSSYLVTSNTDIENGRANLLMPVRFDSGKPLKLVEELRKENRPKIQYYHDNAVNRDKSKTVMFDGKDMRDTINKVNHALAGRERTIAIYSDGNGKAHVYGVEEVNGTKHIVAHETVDIEPGQGQFEAQVRQSHKDKTSGYGSLFSGDSVLIESDHTLNSNGSIKSNDSFRGGTIYAYGHGEENERSGFKNVMGYLASQAGVDVNKLKTGDVELHEVSKVDVKARNKDVKTIEELRNGKRLPWSYGHAIIEHYGKDDQTSLNRLYNEVRAENGEPPVTLNDTQAKILTLRAINNIATRDRLLYQIPVTQMDDTAREWAKKKLNEGWEPPLEDWIKTSGDNSKIDEAVKDALRRINQAPEELTGRSTVSPIPPTQDTPRVRDGATPNAPKNTAKPATGRGKGDAPSTAGGGGDKGGNKPPSNRGGATAGDAGDGGDGDKVPNPGKGDSTPGGKSSGKASSKPKTTKREDKPTPAGGNSGDDGGKKPPTTTTTTGGTSNDKDNNGENPTPEQKEAKEKAEKLKKLIKNYETSVTEASRNPVVMLDGIKTYDDVTSGEKQKDLYYSLVTMGRNDPVAMRNQLDKVVERVEPEFWDRRDELAEIKPYVTKKYDPDSPNATDLGDGDENLRKQRVTVAKEVATEISEKLAEQDRRETPGIVSAIMEAGGTPAGLQFRVKTHASIVSKLHRKAKDKYKFGTPGEDGKNYQPSDLREMAGKVKDGFRFTAVVPKDGYTGKADELVRIMQRNGWTVTKPKHHEFGHYTWDSYPGLNLVFEKNGENVEIQVQTPYSFVAKNATHVAYDIARDGDEENPDIIRINQDQKTIFGCVPTPTNVANKYYIENPLENREEDKKWQPSTTRETSLSSKTTGKNSGVSTTQNLGTGNDTNGLKESTSAPTMTGSRNSPKRKHSKQSPKTSKNTTGSKSGLEKRTPTSSNETTRTKSSHIDTSQATFKEINERLSKRGRVTVDGVDYEAPTTGIPGDGDLVDVPNHGWGISRGFSQSDGANANAGYDVDIWDNKGQFTQWHGELGADTTKRTPANRGDGGNGGSTPSAPEVWDDNPKASAPDTPGKPAEKRAETHKAKMERLGIEAANDVDNPPSAKNPKPNGDTIPLAQATLGKRGDTFTILPRVYPAKTGDYLRVIKKDGSTRIIQVGKEQTPFGYLDFEAKYLPEPAHETTFRDYRGNWHIFLDKGTGVKPGDKITVKDGRGNEHVRVVDSKDTPLNVNFDQFTLTTPATAGNDTDGYRWTKRGRSWLVPVAGGEHKPGDKITVKSRKGEKDVYLSKVHSTEDGVDLWEVSNRAPQVAEPTPKPEPKPAPELSTPGQHTRITALQAENRDVFVDPQNPNNVGHWHENLRVILSPENFQEAKQRARHGYANYLWNQWANEHTPADATDIQRRKAKREARRQLPMKEMTFTDDMARYLIEHSVMAKRLEFEKALYATPEKLNKREAEQVIDVLDNPSVFTSKNFTEVKPIWLDAVEHAVSENGMSKRELNQRLIIGDYWEGTVKGGAPSPRQLKYARDVLYRHMREYGVGENDNLMLDSFTVANPWRYLGELSRRDLSDLIDVLKNDSM